MKLRIKESDEVNPIYAYFVQDICDDDNESIFEDWVKPDELTKYGKEYIDQPETREFLAQYLEPLVDKIKVYPYVHKAWIHTPNKDDTPTGLSNYVRIIFKHPKGISDDEIKQHYRFSIRFSDHNHDEARQDETILDSVEVVGRMPKNFEKAGIKVFNMSVSTVYDIIKKYEINKYGEQKTFF